MYVDIGGPGYEITGLYDLLKTAQSMYVDIGGPGKRNYWLIRSL